MDNTKDKVLSLITEHYLNSNDFNGVSLELIKSRFDIKEAELKNILISLVNDDLISLNFGDIHPNPFIKAFPEEPIKEQISKLNKHDIHDWKYICAYPKSSHLKNIVDVSKYQGLPFKLRLALGEPQLTHPAFDLSILEYYRNDPRFIYENDDIRGWICVRDKYYESNEIKEADKVYIQRFGFSYDKELNRAVAVSLIYLSRLSAEHQQMWKSKCLEGEFFLHPDYLANLMGNWGGKLSIFEAFIYELQVINEMCKAIGKPSLFKNDFKNNKKPRNFSFLIRPTLREFNLFVQLLDVLMSDNINKNFFKNDISLEREMVRDDGRIFINNKGTISLLDEWLQLMVRLEDPDIEPQIIKTFRHIRELRSKPSHSINEDEFDQKYIKQQRELIKEAYECIRSIRLILAIHPNAKNVNVPDLLFKGEIWSI